MRFCSLSEALRDWERICKETTGLTINVPTTACWNQDGDKLLIHRDGSWEQLGKRNRDLWVFYDEGHNITHCQLGKLLELSPRGFILSSASPLSAELVGLFKLLPDGTDGERRECLNTQRTTVVKTADVVKAGLLKTTFHLHRRGTDDFPILKEVTDKRQELELLSSEPIIAGYIVGKRGGVEGTERGLDLWKNLIDMGTPAKEIAVHLDGAKRKAAARAKTEPIYAEVEATYDKSKRGEASSFFKKYKHVIWNISLDEGWDEPWASVLYLDNLQKSEIRVTQRIGRFVRNPFKVNGVPCLPDNVALSTVYIYFQGTDKLVEEIADGLEKDMGIVDGDGVDIIVGSGITHQIEPVKRLLKVDKLSFKPNREKIGEYFINEVLHPELSSPSYSGLGDGRDIKISLSGGKREESKKSLPVGITTIFRRVDWKDVFQFTLPIEVGWWYVDGPNYLIRKNKELEREITIDSSAHKEYLDRGKRFAEKLNRVLDSVIDPIHPYVVPNFTMVNPNQRSSDDEAMTGRYRVYKFVHSAVISTQWIESDGSRCC